MIFSESQPKYSILDLGFNSSLTKALLNLQTPTPELGNVFTSGVAPKSLIAGELISSLEHQSGVIFTGKTAFDNTQIGYRLGLDSIDGLAKFFIGNTTEYLNWNGTTLTITGSISVNSIDIGGADATSMHVDTAGNMWLGNAVFASAPFRVSSSGALTATNATITGTITSTSGTIGGWTLGATSLVSGSGATMVGIDSGGINPAFYAGSSTPGSAPFRVTNAGALTATNANITGTITSTSGTIGGWTIGATTIVGGGVTLDSAGFITGGGIRTATSWERIEINTSGGVNSLRLYDTSGTVALTLYNNAIQFSNLTTGNIFTAGDGTGGDPYRMSFQVGTLAQSLFFELDPYNEIVSISNLDISIQGIIYAETDDLYDLGISTKEWRNLYVDGTAYLDTISAGVAIISEGGTVDIGSTAQNFRDAHLSTVALVDGITAPGTTSGRAIIYVDTADGDLKVKFGDGTVKTIATDT